MATATKSVKAPKNAKGNKATKATKAPRTRKEGLRKSQVAILATLAKTGKPLTRKELAEKSKTDPTKVGVFVGPRKGESQKTSDTFPFPGLFELGFVKVEQHDGEPLVNSITAAGKKALAAAGK